MATDTTYGTLSRPGTRPAPVWCSLDHLGGFAVSHGHGFIEHGSFSGSGKASLRLSDVGATGWSGPVRPWSSSPNGSAWQEESKLVIPI